MHMLTTWSVPASSLVWVTAADRPSLDDIGWGGRAGPGRQYRTCQLT